MKLIEKGKVIFGKQTYVVEIERIVTIEVPVVAETREGAAVKALKMLRANEKCPHVKSWLQSGETLIDAKPQGKISPKEWLEENYGKGLA